ncbi:hypothetical protein Tco_1043310 [Tanacetum coccineum]|uniref:Uncharacterized protein n=1 Tax=Tanacetum coccineum TaxID=301880 RepID=A0ABQ5GMB4_9ASTR
MENTNPPPTNNPHVLPTALRAKFVKKVNKLQAISTYIDSRVEKINQFLNGFTRPPNEIDIDDIKPDDESIDTPLVSPFLESDDDFDDGEVLNELEEYEGLESTGKNLAAIVRDIYVFVESFTYITDVMILKDIGERVPSEQRNEPPAQPKFVYAPILDINYFRHFLDILENYNPVDDEPMWVADRVVAPTPGSAITIPKTANELAIKGSSNSDNDKMARMDAMTMKMDA